MAYDEELVAARQPRARHGRGYWAGVSVLLTLVFVAVPLALVSVQAPDPGPGRSLDDDVSTTP